MARFLLKSGMILAALIALVPLANAGGEGGDDLALDDDGEDEDREHDDEGSRRQRAPGELLEGEHVVDGDRQGACLAPSEHYAEDEIVPREDDRQDGGDDDAGARQRQ